MNVYGIEISQQTLDLAIERMQKETFKAKDIELVILPLLPDVNYKEILKQRWQPTEELKKTVAMRTADRLIQKLRKQGSIQLMGGSKTVWKWKK